MTKSSANEERKDGIHTVFVMQMGQFVDHDITHTPNHAKGDCCGKNGNFPSSFDSNKCYPIEIPRDDPFWQGNKRCMNFARSLSSPSLKCTLEERQQMNQISHWLDASNIYGSSDHEATPLRENAGGRLKISAQVGKIFFLILDQFQFISGSFSYRFHMARQITARSESKQNNFV